MSPSSNFFPSSAVHFHAVWSTALMRPPTRHHHAVRTCIFQSVNADLNTHASQTLQWLMRPYARKNWCHVSEEGYWMVKRQHKSGLLILVPSFTSNPCQNRWQKALHFRTYFPRFASAEEVHVKVIWYFMSAVSGHSVIFDNARSTNGDVLSVPILF